jgi:hypothetical protein
MSTSPIDESQKALDTDDGIMAPKVVAPAMPPRAGLKSNMDVFGWREKLDGMCRRNAARGKTFPTCWCFDRGAVERVFKWVCGSLEKRVAKAQ